MDSGLTLLCVDDDEEELSLLRSTLQREFPAADVITRKGPESGLVTLAVEPVDVVVSDSVSLDDGTPFVEAARNRNPVLPTILYTGRDSTETAPVVSRAGVTEYVQKGEADSLNALVEELEQLAETLDTPDDSDGRAVGFTDTDGDEWTTVTRCDPTSLDELLLAFVEVLDGRIDGRPLAQLVDVEALATVFASHTEPTPLQIRLSLGTHEVVVTDGGDISVRSLTSD